MKWEFKGKMSAYFILQEEVSGATKAADAGRIVSPRSLDALIRQRAASVPWSWGLRSWVIVFLPKFASSVRVLADFNTAWGALTQERELTRASAITRKRALGCYRAYSSGHILQMPGMAVAAALPAGPTFGRSAKIRDELQNSAFKIWKFSDRNLEK